jgi:hypothetical protein
MLQIKKVPERGLVRVSGDVPNGPLTVQRLTPGQRSFTLRGGNTTVSTGGFSMEDSEAPLGIPLTYQATSRPADTLIQRNLVLTPNFTRGTQTWTAGSGRTISPNAPSATVSSSPTGTVRTIAEVGVAPLVPGQRYLVSGQVRFRTPGVWTWQDVKDFGTWAALKAAKANWAAVMTSVSVPSGDSYANLYVSLSTGTTDYMAPMLVFQNSMANANQWITFAAYFTVPAGTPGTARLRLLHGTTTREYSITWDLDQFSLITEADADKVYRLFWFNGDTPVPENPQYYLMQSPDWEDISGDADISWEGTPGTSVSRFSGPTTIATSVQAQLDPPRNVPCEPVLLSDPVSTALIQWFGLSKIDTLTREARATVMSVLGRSDYVSTSSARSSANGTITLYTDTLDDRSNTLRLFQSGRVLLLRNPNPAYPETSWYISCGNVQEQRTIDQDGRKPQRTWVVPFVQVERPTGLIEASSGVTWQQIRDSGMTWRQLRDQRESWLDVALVEP